jgi:hypothetical protein
MKITGTGFPLANAPVSYLLIPVLLNSTYPDFKTIVPNQSGTTYTNGQGLASVQFPLILNQNITYAFIAYAHLNGITGIGCYEHASNGSPCVIPFVDALTAQSVLIANNADVPNNSSSINTLSYNSTFVFVDQNYALRETTPKNQLGSVTSGTGYSYGNITISSYKPGILVIAYGNASSGGVAMVPWGFGSLGFPLTFGGNPASQSMVSTDVRQVQICGVSYQARLSLWDIRGHQVMG